MHATIAFLCVALPVEHSAAHVGRNCWFRAPFVSPVALTWFDEKPDGQAGVSLLDPFRGLQVVQGVVVVPRIGNTSDPIRSKVRITDVFFGSPDLKGSEFLDFSKAEEIRGNSAWPPLEQGEVGIWTIRSVDGQYYAGALNKSGFPFRIREKSSTRFNSLKSTAEAIRKLSKMDLESQLTQAGEWATSTNEDLAGLAVRLLSIERSPKSIAILKRLSENDALSIMARLEIDRALSETEGREWQTGERRKKRLSAVVQSPLDDRQATAAFDLLDEIFQSTQRGNDALDLKVLLELWKSCAANRRLTDATRRSIPFFVARLTFAPKLQDEAFAFLVSLYTSEKEGGLHDAAAYSMCNSSLNESSAKTIRKFLESESNPNLQRAFRGALERYQDATRPR